VIPPGSDASDLLTNQLGTGPYLNMSTPLCEVGSRGGMRGPRLCGGYGGLAKGAFLDEIEYIDLPFGPLWFWLQQPRSEENRHDLMKNVG